MPLCKLLKPRRNRHGDGVGASSPLSHPALITPQRRSQLSLAPAEGLEAESELRRGHWVSLIRAAASAAAGNR